MKIYLDGKVHFSFLKIISVFKYGYKDWEPCDDACDDEILDLLKINRMYSFAINPKKYTGVTHTYTRTRTHTHTHEYTNTHDIDKSFFILSVPYCTNFTIYNIKIPSSVT